MLSITHRTSESSQPRSLPEHLGPAGAALLAADCVAGLLCIGLTGVLGLAAPAFLCVAACLLVGLAIGRYRTSYALQPRDALYESVAPLVLGLPLALLAAVALDFEWWATILAAVLWMAVDGAFSTFMYLGRRGSTHYLPTCEDYGRVRPAAMRTIQLSVIRLLDLAFSLAALTVGLPLFAAIAALIARKDGLPIIFAQRRVGRDETEFLLFKFRTMKNDAGEAWVTPEDDRITKCGATLRRTSLDELPQLFNVLTGSMSLVGPRPEMREYADRFSQTVRGYSWRHLVRPGLTGWAQLHLPRNLRPEDAPAVLDYDLFYVENVSIYLYLFALVKTACELPRHQAV